MAGNDGIAHPFREGEYGAGDRVPAGNDPGVQFGNFKGEGQEAPENAPRAPADPANPAPGEATPQAPLVPDPAAARQAEIVENNSRQTTRDDIIKRFSASREAERNEAARQPPPYEGVPAYLQAPPVDAPVDAAPQVVDPNQPLAAPRAPAAPTTSTDLTLKIRGKEYTATRDQALELIRSLDPMAEIAGMSDVAIRNAAQIAMVSQMKAQEAQQALEAARSPQQPAQAPQQAPQAQQTTENKGKTLDELRAHAVERMQFGDAAEAQEALRAYEDEQYRQRSLEMDRQREAQNAQQQILSDVQAFSARHPALTKPDSPEGGLLLWSAAMEMRQDLASHGYDDRVLSQAMNNPQLMTEMFKDARLRGFRVRDNLEILEAAGAKTYQRLGMSPPSYSQQQPGYLPAPPQQNATDARLEAKRQLQAQPQRANNPVQIPVEQKSVEEKRSKTIQDIIASRRAPNVLTPQGR